MCPFLASILCALVTHTQAKSRHTDKLREKERSMWFKLSSSWRCIAVVFYCVSTDTIRYGESVQSVNSQQLLFIIETTKTHTHKYTPACLQVRSPFTRSAKEDTAREERERERERESKINQVNQISEPDSRPCQLK